jgi:hypothetical protein
MSTPLRSERGSNRWSPHRGSFVFEDLGEQLVKNIAHPVRAFRC